MLNFLLEDTASGGGFGWTSILIIGALFVGMYFLMIRPEKKREKAAQEMRAALSVGDEVTTIGGIIGKVVSIKEETFVLETTRDRTRIRFLVSAIRSVDVKAEEAGAPRTRATTAPKKAAKAEEPAVEETPVAEAPVEETPVTEAPVAEAPVEETPAPTEEAPVAEAPAEEAPAEGEANA